MHTRIVALLLSAALTATLAGGVLAQQQNGPKLYKWVDKNGVTHYGSSVPPEYANQQAAQKATDQMLLDTYTSVADIEQDRSTHLKALDAQMDVTNAAISGLQGNLKAYQQRQQELGRQHRPVPAELTKDLASTQQQLQFDQQLLAQQQQQKQSVQAQFDAYIKRFQQLTATQNNGGG